MHQWHLHNKRHNYLRSYRRKCRLKQTDVAFLLGKRARGTVARHELSIRRVAIETLLAYELILGQPVSAMYRSLARATKRDVARRALVLLKRVMPKGCMDDVTYGRRIEELRRIANHAKAKKHEEHK